MKLFIQSVEPKQWQGKTFINIVANDPDGVLYYGSSTEQSLLEKQDQEVELELKDSGKEFKGNKQWYFNLPKAKTAGTFPKKDYTFEKRRVALECAIQLKPLNETDAIKSAEVFFKWLNQ